MKLAWMIRWPIPNPAWAAAPNGRLMVYTRNRYTATRANSTPAGNPIFRIRPHMSPCGFSWMCSFKYELTSKKKIASQMVPTKMAMSDASPAPATPIGRPVSQPNMRAGASTMLMSTVAVCTIMPGLKLPVPRSAAPMTTIGN